MPTDAEILADYTYTLGNSYGYVDDFGGFP